MKKIIIYIIFFVGLVLAFTWFKNKRGEYNIFKTQLTQKKDFLDFILQSNNSLKLSDKFPQNKDENEIFIEWIKKQFASNEYDISDLGVNQFSIIFNVDKQIAYIVLSDGRSISNLTNTPFNYITKEGYYLIKDDFFWEYLFARDYEIILCNLIR